MKNALNNQVGMLGDMVLWLVANLKQGVIYFIKQALPPNILAGSVLIYNLLIFRKSCLWRLCREGLNLQVVRGLQMMLSTVLSISLKRLIWALLENLSCKGWSKTFWKNWGLETIRKWNKDVEKWQIYSAQIFFASYSLQPVCTGIEDFYINHVYIWFVFIDEMKFLRKERKFWQI